MTKRSGRTRKQAPKTKKGKTLLPSTEIVTQSPVSEEHATVPERYEFLSREFHGDTSGLMALLVAVEMKSASPVPEIVPGLSPRTIPVPASSLLPTNSSSMAAKKASAIEEAKVDESRDGFLDLSCSEDSPIFSAMSSNMTSRRISIDALISKPPLAWGGSALSAKRLSTCSEISSVSNISSDTIPSVEEASKATRGKKRKLMLTMPDGRPSKRTKNGSVDAISSLVPSASLDAVTGSFHNSLYPSLSASANPINTLRTLSQNLADETHQEEYDKVTELSLCPGVADGDFQPSPSEDSHLKQESPQTDIEESKMQPIDRGKNGRSSKYRRYACPFSGCHYQDNKKFNVQNHINGHLQRCPYTCPVLDCNYSAKQKTHVNQHLLKHHPEVCVDLPKGKGWRQSWGSFFSSNS